MRMRREQKAFLTCVQVIVPLLALLLTEFGLPGSWLMIIATLLYTLMSVRGTVSMLVFSPIVSALGVYLVTGDILNAVNVVLGFVPVGLTVGLLIKYGKRLKTCVMSGACASLLTYFAAVGIGAFFTHKKLTVSLFFNAYMTTFSKVEEAFSLVPKIDNVKLVYVTALFRDTEFIEQILPAVMILSAMVETFVVVCAAGYLLERMHVKTMLAPLSRIILMRRSAVVFVFPYSPSSCFREK